MTDEEMRQEILEHKISIAGNLVIIFATLMIGIGFLIFNIIKI